MRSNYVITPMVRTPVLSTSLANFSPSEIAKSSEAFVTAKMMALGFMMKGMIMSIIRYSISGG